MKLGKSLIFGSILLVIFQGICWGQLNSTQQKLVDEYLSKKKSPEIRPQQSGEVEQYKSPEYFSAQDSQFYLAPDGAPPPAMTADSSDALPTAAFEDLKIFGYNMFDGSPESFSPVLEASPPPDYKLGPGDDVLINIWGRVDMQLDLVVDREGKVFIPRAGEIVAWGLTLDEFKGHVGSKLSSIYSDYKFSISLGKIRRIKVFVYGEVKRPGGYTTSSLSTLFNALYLAGGPTENGSLRAIKHLRGNQAIAQIDLYQFLIKGDNSQDARLESGDVIFVPVVGPLVKIAGEIKRPAIYEIKGGEKISDIIELAGGSTAEAFMEMVNIDRVAEDDSRTLAELNLSEAQRTSNIDEYNKANLALRDGDCLNVPSIDDFRKNTVALTGNVKHPGRFGLSDSMTVMDLVDNGEQFKRETYLKRANLFRTSTDQTRQVYKINFEEILAGIDSTNLRLADRDSLVIYSQSDIRRDMTVSIYGAVKSPGAYEYFENMKLSDLIFLGGNPLKQSYMLQAEIARANPGRPANIIHANLGNVLNGNNAADDILLAEDDVVYIRTIPRWRQNDIVTVEGEVMFPGAYSLTRDRERLLDLLSRCGGLTPEAFKEGLIFQRSSIVNDVEKRQIRGILGSMETTVLDSLNRPMPKLAMNMDISGLNRIILDTQKLFDDPGSPDNIILNGGDYIYVPRRPSGVQVLGAVASNGTIAFKKGRKLDYYIKSAGGYCSNAEKKQTRLAKANGLVLAGGKAFHSNIDPGDVIIIPQEIKREKQWLRSTSSVAAIIGSLATVFLIADRMK